MFLILVAIDGMVCDISDLTMSHPGGADLLLQHAGADVTEEFRDVGHSHFVIFISILILNVIGICIGIVII